MKPLKIVITGGPGTGKTSLINALKQNGFCCCDEIIREMTLKAKAQGDQEHLQRNPLTFVKDPYLFNKRLLRERIEQFRKASESHCPSIFFDRGIPDVLAYMDHFHQPYGEEFIKACTTYRYDQVLILPPWKAIYTQDDARLENFEESKEIHEVLEKTYANLGYSPIEIPKGTVNDRLDFVTKLVNERFQQ